MSLADTSADTLRHRPTPVMDELLQRYLEFAQEIVRTGTSWNMVAMRARDGHDFPFVTAESVEPSFVEKECNLLADSTGALECVCGCVIRQEVQRFPGHSTAFGSFVRNTKDGLEAVRAATPSYREWCEAFESLLLAPVVCRSGEVVGLLHVVGPEPGGMDEASVEHAQALARRLAHVIHALESSRATHKPIRRVLVVDDDPMMCNIVRCLLSRVAQTVWVTHSAAEGIAALEAQRVDVVLTDLQMPGGDGDGLVREIQGRWRHYAPRIVLMSGAQDLESLADALHVRALHKPFGMQQLYDAVMAAD